jgi:hypothetical protein
VAKNQANANVVTKPSQFLCKFPEGYHQEFRFAQISVTSAAIHTADVRVVRKNRAATSAAIHTADVRVVRKNRAATSAAIHTADVRVKW